MKQNKIKIISTNTQKDITARLKNFELGYLNYLKKQGEIEVYANKINS